ncbi:MAG: protein-L-isoaspartate(D-aspartate) O-methyltransferase [Bacteroidales bacterium]|nr:protein-L-isoaspartate(D-aspartate) O-methyltransferase [Bacteroidales bacterium]
MKIAAFSVSVFFLILLPLFVFSQKDEAAWPNAREQMVDQQIATRGISHAGTLNAMKKVPRHVFIPKNQLANAYRDSPLPIGYGQTISQPYIVAYMTEMIDPKPHHKVLEIGTGSGYQAAVLAEIVNEVYTIEIIPELAKSSKDVFEKLGYKNVKVKTADGYHGWAEAGPFDAIVVTAATEHIPPPLIEQLKEGGRMIIPVGTPFLVQQLVLVEKVKGKIRSKNLIPVRFVPFTRGDSKE